MTPKIFLLGLLASISILVPGSLGKPPGQSPASYNNQQSANQQPQVQIQAQGQTLQGNQASGYQISSSNGGSYYTIQKPNAIPIIQYIPTGQTNVGAQLPIGLPSGIQALPGNLGSNVQIIGLPQFQQQLQQLQQPSNGAIYVLVNSQGQQSPIQLIPIGYPNVRPLPISQPQILQIQIPQIPQGQFQVQQEATTQSPQFQIQQQVQQPQLQSQIQIQGPSQSYKPQQENLYIPAPVTQKPQLQVQVQNNLPTNIYKQPQNTYQQNIPTQRPQGTYQQIVPTQKPQGIYQPIIPTQKPQGSYLQSLPTEKPQETYGQNNEFQSLNLQLTDQDNEGPQISL